MSHYALQFHHEVIRKPMLAYKKRVLTQILSRQVMDRAITAIEDEIDKKEKEYEEELEQEFDEDEEDEDGLKERQQKLEKRILKIGKRVDGMYEKVADLHKF